MTRWKLITFDVDGTLTTVHGWEFLAGKVGRAAEYRRSNQRFRAREVGEDEHLADLLRLADGLTVPQVERILEETPKVGGIAEMIQRWHGEGTKVALLSHNPEYVCAWYSRRFGFDGYAGTPVKVADGDGRIELVGGVHADKSQGLRQLLGQFGVPGRATVHVGDGWADAALFALVGAGVALNSPLPEVERAADLALHLLDVRGLPERVDALRPRARPDSSLR
jgi:HAD superfamily phosphoserine phosphatase-like hydrolase